MPLRALPILCKFGTCLSFELRLMVYTCSADALHGVRLMLDTPPDEGNERVRLSHVTAARILLWRRVPPVAARPVGGRPGSVSRAVARRPAGPLRMSRR